MTLNIYFANVEKQALDIRQSDEDLNDGYIQIDEATHAKIYQALNTQSMFFTDFSVSPPRPTPYCEWIDGQWIDNRTDAEKRASFLESLTALTQRQFKLILSKNNLLKPIETAIENITDEQKKSEIQIEYNYATSFERDSDSIIYMATLLKLTDDQVDQMWQDAMKI